MSKYIFDETHNRFDIEDALTITKAIWADGNSSNENRLGLFVTADDDGSRVTVAKTDSYICGVTVSNDTFLGLDANDKKYCVVQSLGLCTVRDDGSLAKGDKCMPASDGTAVISTNNLGFRVVGRVDDSHVQIIMSPNNDMIQRIKRTALGRSEYLTDEDFSKIILGTYVDGDNYLDTAPLDIRQTINQALSNIETKANNTANKVNEIEENVNEWLQIESDAAAELADARLAYGGKRYDSVGEAIRNQIAAAMESGGASDEQIASAVERYLSEHPIEGGSVTPEQLAEAVKELVKPIEDDMTQLKSYTGLVGYDDVAGLCVDYANKTFERIAGAAGKTAGADFDSLTPFGGRRRCNVADDGTIVAYYGDAGYTEDGSNGQVMVYQPKFYYLVVPIKFDKNTAGLGYHLRKVNYYVSSTKHSGFKLHPAFVDKNGQEVDYILMSAFEGCIYDTSTSAYLLNDEQVADFNNDLFCSVANARPASGLTQNLIRPNVEKLAQNRGADWHSLGIKTASMEQLLMIVEMGTMNLQTAIGQGVVSITDNSAQPCASFTGSTTGNDTGEATSSKDYSGTVQTASGKKSICYRGVENFWGNVWKHAYGVNIWGNGSMAGGQPFICSDFNYAESKNSDNYEGAGFCMANAGGYISAMGYSVKYDWLFMASECLGNSSLPVGDYTHVISNLNGYRIAQLGGRWGHGTDAGGFYWAVNSCVGHRHHTVGGRLVYVPTARN